MTGVRVTRKPPAAGETVESAGWWSRYLDGIPKLGFTETGTQVLTSDCSYIVDSGIFGVGNVESDEWPPSRVRRGIVMGAVQSGKTASMFGVAAQSLDREVDIVVVLAGSNLALWRQTYQRFIEQLDLSELGDVARARQRVLIPGPELMAPESGASPPQLYGANQALIGRAVQQHRPIIAIVMKNVHHLRALSRLLHE